MEATEEAIRHGEIEGVCLIGLTEQSTNLFENDVTKLSDLQTAVLALSDTCLSPLMTRASTHGARPTAHG